MFALFNNRQPWGGCMATARTGSFYLTETVTLPGGSASGTRVTGTVDLGAYVDVASGQAIAIDSVDFILQSGATFAMSVNAFLTGNGGLGYQLTDQNPGTAFVRADNHSLIASGGLSIDDANNIGTHTADLYPDNYGSASSLSEMFMVVNDTLFLTCGNNEVAIAAADLQITARIRCRVVKLGKMDWMAIAIQSTADQ